MPMKSSKEMLKSQIEKLHADIIRIRGPWEEAVKAAEAELQKSELEERMCLHAAAHARGMRAQLQATAQEKLQEAAAHHKLAAEYTEKARLCDEEARQLVAQASSAEEAARHDFEIAVSKTLAAAQRVEHAMAAAMTPRAKHLCRVLQVKIAKLERRVGQKKPHKEGCVSVHPIYSDRDEQ